MVNIDGVWQPNPGAENLSHLPGGSDYYLRMMPGQTDEFIRVFCANERAFVVDGKPVFPEFHDTTHTASEALAPVPEWPLYVGLDFGLSPAAIIGQRGPTGAWHILDELIAEDMGAQQFGELLVARFGEWYPEIPEIQLWGDPAGAQRAQTDEKTCFRIIEETTGIRCRPAPSNNFTLRREAVASVLRRLVDGKPAFRLSPHCRTLRRALMGGYRFRRLALRGDESRFHDVAEKNSYSHPADALQYLLAGAGEGRALLGREKRKRSGPPPQRANSKYNPFQWGPRA